MSLPDLLSSGYERKARLYPAFLLILPMVVTGIAALSLKIGMLKAGVTGLIACGATFGLAQLARDRGYNRQPYLFNLWGGSPSIAIFRHRNARLDPITKARYHQKLAELVPETRKLPTPASEQENPDEADRVYAAWSNFLRVSTRDTKKYDLLFAENVNYGYRRNTWGLRPWGIAFSVVSLAFAVYQVYASTKGRSLAQTDAKLTIALCFDALALVLWLFVVKAEWVRLAANAYADRLAEACESIPKPEAPPSKLIAP